MKRALILAALLPSVAWGQTSAPQFVPPNGLPLDTPLGAARNADGTGVVTFATMLAGISAAVTPAQMQSALADYLTISSAASTYATPSSVAAAVQTETNRAEAAEQANASNIATVQSTYVSTNALETTLGSYVTGAALQSALAPYLTQASAANLYLPLTGGTIKGNLSVSGNITLPGSTSILSHDIAHILALAGDFSTSTQAITNSNNVSLVTYGTGLFNFYSTTLGLVYSISPSSGPTIKPLAGTGNAFACINTSGTLYRSSSACQ